MRENLNMMEGILGRCRTCVKNLYRLICDTVCSPEQSRFVNVTKSTKEDDIEYVDESEVNFQYIELLQKFTIYHVKIHVKMYNKKLN